MRMRVVPWLAIVLAACGGGGASDDGDDDGAGSDGAAIDSAAVDAPGSDGTPTTDAGGGGPSILFQCDGTGGGICAMDGDGDNRRTILAAGFVPHGLADGSILFHTSTYRVSRRSSGGNVADLGDGAFARPHPDGRILFQCTGLGGGLCVMNADGSNRSTIKATGRVPDIDTTGRILFHSDDYHVWRRDSGGGETDLGLGAFPTWAPDGRILFQCAGLGGGICRMNPDGSNRATIDAAGRVPDEDPQGRILFHSDSYQVNLRSSSTTTPLGAGANATWW